MQPEHFARLYNGGFYGGGNKLGEFGCRNQPCYADAARLLEKDREQLLQMSGRGFAAANVGFHIELGEERDDRSRRGVVYDSSSRDHEWASEDARNRATAGDESYHGIAAAAAAAGRNNHEGGSHSDGSEDYEEEELDLEADGRDVVGGSVCEERNSLVQASGQDGVFQKMNSDKISASGMFSFFKSLARESGVVRGGRADNEGNGVPDSMYFNPLVSTDSGEKRVAQQDNSVRHFLSDPISGRLMEDAVIFPCGHSVGNAGFQRVQETNACVVCMSPTPPMSAAPNHALRTAVLAFKRDHEFPILTAARSAKRRREQEDDTGKVKGVQFPYTVSDRVLIKGNKRTPERFVGREAIITNQCLNGWYLVRTIDNGESVRLQYRSLQKLGD